MSTKRFILISFICLTVVSLLNAQVARQSGIIRGVVVDNEGSPIPGVTVTASGPKLMGTRSDMTRVNGSFRLVEIPPGVYTATAELGGFTTSTAEEITVRVGMIVSVNFTIQPETLAEEIVVTAVAPTVDIQSSKISHVVTTEIMARLPLNRDFLAIFNTVPGVSGTLDTYSGSIHGATDTTTTYEIDGANANSPTHGGPLVYPHYDAMEEVEIVTGGLPAQVGNTGGAYVNIVLRAGGNKFSGSAQFYYTNEDLSTPLYPDEQLTAMGMGAIAAPIFDWDASFTLGGPIINDKIWFFADLGILKDDAYGNFIPTTILGKSYEQFNLPTQTWRGMAKITAQLTQSLKFFVMFHGEYLDKDVYNWWNNKNTYDSRFTLIGNTRVATTVNLTWLLGSNTFVDLRAGYVNRWYPITTDPDFDANNAFSDGYTGYTWNGIPSWQSKIKRQTRQASAKITHFLDDTLGGDHEFGAGVEYVWGLDGYGYERTNPMTWYYYDGNPYYYREYYDLPGPHSANGDGRLRFVNCGSKPGDSSKDLVVKRWGFYVQDAFTIQNRLTINAGIRLDAYNGYMANAKSTGTTGLAFEIGESFEDQLGFNPFGPLEVENIYDVMVFSEWSPRIGLSYDLFGDGKTALKVAYSRYTEQVPVWRFSEVSPAVLANYYINWWDTNNNGTPDSPGVDAYEPRSGYGQFTVPDTDYLLSRVDPDKAAPSYNEFVASINHQLFTDVSVKLQYLYKLGKGAHSTLRYDRETGRYWHSLEAAAEGWYIPFRTTVPAIGEYPEQSVTVYYRTNDSPQATYFSRSTNNPDSKQEYHGVELSFDKRQSHGWALGGSVVLSQHKRITPSDPNDFTFGFGRDGYDRPLQIKLFGSFELPYGIMTSFFYVHASGTPYGRSVSVAAPDSWVAANNVYAGGANESVRLEESGTRRNQSTDNIDFRLEKEFHFSFGRLGVFMDVYNLLGNRYAYAGQNPGGSWRPVAENSSVGVYSPTYNYGRITGVAGVRIFKFSVRLTF